MVPGKIRHGICDNKLSEAAKQHATARISICFIPVLKIESTGLIYLVRDFNLLQISISLKRLYGLSYITVVAISILSGISIPLGV